MFKFKLIFSMVLVAILFVIQACGPVGVDEAGCNFHRDKNNLYRLSWNSEVYPIVIYMDSSFESSGDPKGYRASLQRAVNQFNAVFKMEFYRLSARIVKTVDVEDGLNVVRYIPHWVGGKKVQANTHTYAYGKNISEFDISVNSSFNYYTGYSANQINSNQVDFESLMVHELGHAVGLSHRHSDENSVMVEVLPNNEIRRSLTDSDKASLSCEYDVS